MANISEIQNEESGLSVRTKLNAAIAEANKVDDKADAAALAGVATSGSYNDLSGAPSLGTMSGESAGDYTPTSSLGSAAFTAASDYATATQGTAADSAVQPGDLAAVATSGDYSDLSGLPTLGSAASTDASAYATAGQGSLAETALQPGDALTSSDFSAIALVDDGAIPDPADPTVLYIEFPPA